MTYRGIREGEPNPNSPGSLLSIRRQRIPTPIIPAPDRGIIAGGPPRSVTIGTASTLILQANAARKKVYLVNDATEPIYIARADSAVMNAGIRLNTAGGSLVDEPDSQGRIYTGPYYGICASGSMNLCVEEDY